MKNAAKATVDEHDGGLLPPVNVIIVDGKDDITIRISDEGGGIKRKNIDKIWSYLHSTAQDPGIHHNAVEESHTGGSTASVLAGYGVGLPLSRQYARYFGGDLDIKSLEGYGTDAYLHLSKLGEDCEGIPDIVGTSPGQGSSSVSSTP